MNIYVCIIHISLFALPLMDTWVVSMFCYCILLFQNSNIELKCIQILDSKKKKTGQEMQRDPGLDPGPNERHEWKRWQNLN